MVDSCNDHHMTCAFCTYRCEDANSRAFSAQDIAVALQRCKSDKKAYFADLQRRLAENPELQFYIHIKGCHNKVRVRTAPPPTDPMAVSSSAATTAATPAATRSNQESAKEEALATQEGAF